MKIYLLRFLNIFRVILNLNMDRLKIYKNLNKIFTSDKNLGESYE